MYAVLTYNITIGDLSFKQVNEVVIERSVDSLSDTATIKLPTSFLLGNESEGLERKSLIDVIKTKDKVEISLGYDGIYSGVEFRGFVKSINPNTPLEIECEDAIYLIRKGKECNKNFQNTDLSEILEYIVEGTGVKLSSDIPKVNFDKFLMKGVNGAKALEDLKEAYGLTIYIDNNGDLFAGLRQQQGAGEPVVYHLQKNTVNNDLKFREEDSIQLSIKAIAHQKDNTKIEVEVGDSDGERRTLHFYNISDEKQLKQIAEEKLKTLKYTGYEGSVVGFLVPFADRGMAATIKDDKYPVREGNYLIEKVKIVSGVSGARRTVFLGNKL